MELAKQQKATQSNNDDDSNNSQKKKKSEPVLSEKQIQERNDRLRFEDLLQQSSMRSTSENFDDYLNPQQQEAELQAAERVRRSKKPTVDRLFQGDPAPIECFADLHHIGTETPLGTNGMERLIPWLQAKNNNNNNDFLLCLVDPREKSHDLRQAVKQLVSSSPPAILQKLIVINADSPAENRRWMKRNKHSTITTLTTTTAPALQGVYSDETLEWMRSYSALGETRWSMTLFLLAQGKVQRLVREVDMYDISNVVVKLVQSFQNELQLSSNDS